MIDKGETDFNIVEDNLGVDCSSTLLDIEGKINCQNLVNNQILANKNGTSTSLGGRSRLRSYGESRFSGAHTEFYGSEFRWNIVDDSKPFDIYFMKGEVSLKLFKI